MFIIMDWAPEFEIVVENCNETAELKAPLWVRLGSARPSKQAVTVSLLPEQVESFRTRLLEAAYTLDELILANDRRSAAEIAPVGASEQDNLDVPF